ncbi:MAG: D-alanyl-D-alanine carboxypeptidase/D-alanyl-D-alanine-endopeptidase, partial [Candidatus Edwardsbacteria bacterium]|nr:D-alanyl-D-alanine carboxypeptidase/D-alanyl-D-alanine-endopeptidase [Candidatus Edwardsbacteria bacterium]
TELDKLRAIMKKTHYIFYIFLALAITGCGGRAALRQEPPSAVSAPGKFVDSAAVKRSLLAARIDSLLADSSLAQAAVGVYIVAIDGKQEELYAKNKSQLFTPASVNKLFTTAAAFKQWGPYHRFQTRVCGDSIDQHGRVNGDLYLQGLGAPDLKTSDLDRLAFALKATGLRFVAGDIVANASFFDTTAFGAGWMWDEGPYAYNAPVSALSLGGNAFDLGIRPGSKPGRKLFVEIDPLSAYFRLDNKGFTGKPEARKSLKANRAFTGAQDEVRITGSLAQNAPPLFLSRSVTNPKLYCATMFRAALARRGIKVKGKITTGEMPDSLPALSVVNSRPLYAIVQDMDKESDNFTAEMLFRNLNQDSTAAPDSGKNRAAQYLLDIGCAPESFAIADGSGLSRYNLCTPEQLVKVLLSVYQNPVIRPELLVALPMAGIDGTLYQRMKNGEGRSKVRAKTGTMTGVSCLAGFAFGPGEKVYCFALMFNNYTAKADEVRPLQDEILRELLFIAP